MSPEDRAKQVQATILHDITRNLAQYRSECEAFSMRTEDDQAPAYNESMQAFYAWMMTTWETALDQFATKRHEIEIGSDKFTEDDYQDMAEQKRRRDESFEG